MTLNQSALIELLKELELTDTTERIRLLTQRAFQKLINAEAETVIGAAPYERSESRATQRNGTRPRTLSALMKGSGYAKDGPSGDDTPHTIHTFLPITPVHSFWPVTR